MLTYKGLKSSSVRLLVSFDSGVVELALASLRKLVYQASADVCWRMLTYADVCLRMLTYAGVVEVALALRQTPQQARLPATRARGLVSRLPLQRFSL